MNTQLIRAAAKATWETMKRLTLMWTGVLIFLTVYNLTSSVIAGALSLFVLSLALGYFASNYGGGADR